MKAEVYWIGAVEKSRLAVMPRPRGGDWLEDEIKSLRLSGVNVLVSLLAKEETEELDLMEESRWCAAHGIQFVSFPITDRGVPASRQETLKLVENLKNLVASGKGVAIHCRQGIGRSGMIAACVLAALGDTIIAAFEQIVQARGCPVPDTPEQRAWAKSFVEKHLPDVR